MLEAIKFAHEHIKNQISAQDCCFEKKEVRTYEGEREDEAIYAKVKQHLTIKYYYSKGSSKQERTAAFDVKEVKALFTEEELAENGDLVSKYQKPIKKQFVT
jgi:polyribonucleotide nucleotidyltransferase